jgi:predicted nucleotidyltransferase
MDVRSPATALVSDLEAPILGVLTKTTKPLSGRQVARLADRSQNGTRQVLQRLTRHGLVQREDVATSALYRLNRDHIAFDAVIELVSLRAHLVKRLEREIASWAVAPVHASLFGSMARGDGDSESDIDILVVRPRGLSAESPHWHEQLSRLREKTLAWTGNELGVTEIAELKLPQLLKQRPGLVHDLRRDGITLAGVSAKALLVP